MGTAPEDDVRAALAEVEREWLKAAAIGAVVDAALAMVAVSVAAMFFWPSGFTRPIVGPIPVGAVLVVFAGLAVASAELALQRRRPTVERFEAANPEVREALRTARDAVERDHRGPVAAAHYRTVVDRLGETSSRDLLPVKRMMLTVAVVGVLAVGGLFVPAGGAVDAVTASLGGGGIDGAESDDPVPTGESSEYQGLQEGDEVLGSESNISVGDRNLSVPVRSHPGGSGSQESNGTGPDGGLGADEPIEPQPAGYAAPTPVEDADLIREYTLAIQAAGQTDAEETNGTEDDDNE